MKARHDYQALISEYEASGLSQSAFCRRKRVNIHTFRLRLGEVRKAKAAPNFLPLAVVPPLGHDVEIRYADGALLCLRGADVSLIRELLAAPRP